MSVLYTILIILFIINAILLITVILLQSGKGGMGTIFGGGGSSSVFGATGAATLLQKLTVIFAIVFMLISFGLARITIDAAQTSPLEKICNDKIDNDKDGKTDCDDEDCKKDPFCNIKPIDVTPKTGKEAKTKKIEIKEQKNVQKVNKKAPAKKNETKKVNKVDQGTKKEAPTTQKGKNSGEDSKPSKGTPSAGSGTGSTKGK